jgi:hypothetical protein
MGYVVGSKQINDVTKWDWISWKVKINLSYVEGLAQVG